MLITFHLGAVFMQSATRWRTLALESGRYLSMTLVSGYVLVDYTWVSLHVLDTLGAGTFADSKVAQLAPEINV